MKIVTVFAILAAVLLAVTFFAPQVQAGVSYPVYQNCNNHAYRDCVGNSVYWFNSCGNSQDLIQICSQINQICKYGECANYAPVPPPPPPAPVYINHYRASCYNKNLYWYDSLGKVQTLYKSCADDNQCTEDACSGTKCKNSLRCDGTTCAIGSPDYCKSCAAAADQACNKAVELTVTFFAKKDLGAVSWDKTTQIGQNGNIYFLAIVENTSDTEASNAKISASIPGEIGLLGNLKIDGSAGNGEITSEVDIGSIPANGSKIITFEGRTQSFSASGDKQAVLTVNAGEITQSDSITINLSPSQTAEGPSDSAGSRFMDFLKRWYLWILAALVLIFLFIIIFRRLSSNV